MFPSSGPTTASFPNWFQSLIFCNPAAATADWENRWIHFPCDTNEASVRDKMDVGDTWTVWVTFTEAPPRQSLSPTRHFALIGWFWTSDGPTALSEENWFHFCGESQAMRPLWPQRKNIIEGNDRWKNVRQHSCTWKKPPAEPETPSNYFLTQWSLVFVLQACFPPLTSFIKHTYIMKSKRWQENFHFRSHI